MSRACVPSCRVILLSQTTDVSSTYPQNNHMRPDQRPVQNHVKDLTVNYFSKKLHLRYLVGV